jgi:RNA polymerase sigma-70 factor (ECF subfamily)
MELDSPTQSPAVLASVLDVVAPQDEAQTISASELKHIYKEHFSYVWHSLRRLGILEKDLEDLSHDVFIAFYKNGSFDRSRAIKPWLFGICFRVASDHRRRAYVRLEVAPKDEAAWAGQAPPADELYDEQARRRLVQNALETLDMDQRSVFIMHDIDGYSMPEIQAVLDVPLNTLYSRLRLARNHFANAVKKLKAGGGR